MPKKRKKTGAPIIVVQARVPDLNTVQQLHNECFPDKPKSLRWYMQKLATEESTYICNVAKISGTDAVIGYVLAKLAANRMGEIVALGVAPMYRGQGIGRLILAHFLDECKGIVEGVQAYVPDSSEYLAAQLFLRECGFPDSRLDRKKNAIKFQRSLV